MSKYDKGSGDYVIGAKEADKGIYDKKTGTEVVGYFVPSQVVFRVLGDGSINVAEVGDIFMSSCIIQALQGVGVGWMTGNFNAKSFVDDMLRIANNSEVKKFLVENTVMPFFKKYSLGKKTIVEKTLYMEILLNSLLNFICQQKASKIMKLEEYSQVERFVIKAVKKDRKKFPKK